MFFRENGDIITVEVPKHSPWATPAVKASASWGG
jgi:hypothetical protein